MRSLPSSISDAESDCTRQLALLPEPAGSSSDGITSVLASGLPVAGASRGHEMEAPRHIPDEPKVPELRWRGRTQRCVTRADGYALISPSALLNHPDPVLDFVAWHGEEESQPEGQQNLLIEGDSLDALGALARAVNRTDVRGVKLAYL